MDRPQIPDPQNPLIEYFKGSIFSIENSSELGGVLQHFYHFQKSPSFPKKKLENDEGASPSNIIDATAAHKGSEAANNATSEPLTRRNASLANHMVSTSSQVDTQQDFCQGSLGMMFAIDTKIMGFLCGVFFLQVVCVCRKERVSWGKCI